MITSNTTIKNTVLASASTDYDKNLSNMLIHRCELDKRISGSLIHRCGLDKRISGSLIHRCRLDKKNLWQPNPQVQIGHSS